MLTLRRWHIAYRFTYVGQATGTSGEGGNAIDVIAESVDEAIRIVLEAAGRKQLLMSKASQEKFQSIWREGCWEVAPLLLSEVSVEAIQNHLSKARVLAAEISGDLEAPFDRV